MTRAGAQETSAGGGPVGPERAPYWPDLDAARSVLMGLGVVLHAANVYGAHGDWLVADPPGTPALDALSDGIHLFRMPAFFVVAGFFSAMTLRRSGPERFLARRLLRLGVPLATTALTLNSVQSWLLYAEAGGELGLARWLASPAFRETWASGTWVTHLWFLIYLLVYVAVAYVLARLAPMRRLFAALGRGVARAERSRLVRSGLFVLLLPCVDVTVVVACWTVPGTWRPLYGDISLGSLAAYVPHFAVGALLHGAPAAFTAFRSFHGWLAPVTLLAAWVARVAPERPEGALAELGRVWLDALLPWLACVWVFAVFRATCRRRSALFAWLSDGSYTIYLLHHLLVIAGGLALGGAPLGPWAKFALLFAGTTAATVAAHVLVLRSPVLRLLFNGKRARARRAPGA